jgi:sigma-B regulation protein RsbU (phosphoserine phosphatase)
MRSLDQVGGVWTGRGVLAPRVEVAGWASSRAGRDGLDDWRLPDGRQALFLGDVSVRGAEGAAAIARVRALLRTLSEERADPTWLLSRVNALLIEDVAPSRFVTAFMACLGVDGWLDWCSAGQGPVYVRRRARDDYDALPAQVAPLGVDRDLQLEEATSLHLGPGGRVAVVSDGVLDADNGAGLVLGPRRVKTVLDNTSSLPLGKVVELIRDVLSTWQGSDGPADDQSILIAGLAD